MLTSDMRARKSSLKKEHKWEYLIFRMIMSPEHLLKKVYSVSPLVADWIKF